MSRVSSLTLGLVVVLAVLSVQVEAAPRDSIAFLKFTMTQGRLAGADVSVVPGKLKQPKVVTPLEGHLYYTVQNREREILFEGVIPDPSRMRYEYVDDQGRLQSIVRKSDSVAFYLRIPYRPDASQAEFSRIEGVAVEAGKTVKSLRSLGTVDIARQGADR